MRGDPPLRSRRFLVRSKSTPHARGSTHREIVSNNAPVYPACAGIHPSQPSISARMSCLPRMRGDPPGGKYVS